MRSVAEWAASASRPREPVTRPAASLIVTRTTAANTLSRAVRSRAAGRSRSSAKPSLIRARVRGLAQVDARRERDGQRHAGVADVAGDEEDQRGDQAGAHGEEPGEAGERHWRDILATTRCPAR